MNRLVTFPVIRSVSCKEGPATGGGVTGSRSFLLVTDDVDPAATGGPLRELLATGRFGLGRSDSEVRSRALEAERDQNCLVARGAASTEATVSLCLCTEAASTANRPALVESEAT